MPKSDYPNRVVIKYADYSPSFRMSNLITKYKKSHLHEQGIDYIEFEQTILRAQKYLEPYRGTVAKID